MRNGFYNEMWNLKISPIVWFSQWTALFCCLLVILAPEISRPRGESSASVDDYHIEDDSGEFEDFLSTEDNVSCTLTVVCGVCGVCGVWCVVQKLLPDWVQVSVCSHSVIMSQFACS